MEFDLDVDHAGTPDSGVLRPESATNMPRRAAQRILDPTAISDWKNRRAIDMSVSPQNLPAYDRPLRIAMVAACPFPLSRGTPVRIHRMAEALADRGNDVHVVTYHLGTGRVNENVHVHRTRNLKFYSKLSAGPSPAKLALVDPLLTVLLRKVLKTQPFDVVHAHHYEGLLVGALARGDVPMVYDAHTLLMSELPFYKMGLPTSVKARIGKWFDHYTPRFADHTVCVTDTIRDKLVKETGLDAARASVIMNGVEFEHFDPDLRPPAPPTDGRTVLFTGNLASYQGIDHLLKAFAIVRGQIPDARLVIATASDFAPYESLARGLGILDAIELIDSPSFDELPAIIASGDVCMNPRVDGDGVPVKMLNYMAAGRPVVSFASSAPGVVHNRTGWLAESGNASSLAEGIVTLLRNPEMGHRIGREARQYIKDNCRWPGVAERLEKLYRSLMVKSATV